MADLGVVALGIALDAQKKIKSMPNGFKPLGSVSTYNDLPASGNEVGDSYTVQNADADHKAGRYVWGQSGGILTWYYLDGDVDYVSQTEFNEFVNNPMTIEEVDALFEEVEA